MNTNGTNQANVSVNIDLDVNITCYFNQALDIPAHPCSGTYGRLSHTSCVSKAVLSNEWRCNKCQYEKYICNGHPLWAQSNIHIKTNRVGVKDINVGLRAQQNQIQAKVNKLKDCLLTNDDSFINDILILDPLPYLDNGILKINMERAHYMCGRPFELSMMCFYIN